MASIHSNDMFRLDAFAFLYGGIEILPFAEVAHLSSFRTLHLFPVGLVQGRRCTFTRLNLRRDAFLRSEVVEGLRLLL